MRILSPNAYFRRRDSVAIMLAGYVICLGVPDVSMAQGSTPLDDLERKALTPGQTLQTAPRELPMPKPAGPAADISPNPLPATAPGGLQVTLQSIALEGNTAFSREELLKLVASDLGTRVDLGGIQSVANKLTDYYRSKGFAFARVIIPAQAINDPADVRMEVIEGRYGKVSVKAHPNLASAVGPFLRALQSGGLIQADVLERNTLILNDLPGVVAVPVIRPGSAGGTGDLEYVVRATPRYTGDIGLDNHGGRYTGAARLVGGMSANRVFTLGDQAQFRGMLTSESLWFASGSYAFPINASSLRGRLSASRTSYTIGKELKAAGTTGTAATLGVGLSYPLVRSQAANLTLSVDLQDKRLSTQPQAPDLEIKTSSSLLPVGLQFDRSDSLFGGGVWFGSITVLQGDLKLGTNPDPYKTAGQFKKTNVDLYRLQRVSNTLSVYGRYSQQWADKNLDSSEDIGLGGPTSVRAYPSGEGGGDEGWLGQIELRLSLPLGFAPYVFYDTGTTVFFAKPEGLNATRRLEGRGVGLRFKSELWSLDATLSWRGRGGESQADRFRDDPGVWLSVSRNL